MAPRSPKTFKEQIMLCGSNFKVASRPPNTFAHSILPLRAPSHLRTTLLHTYFRAYIAQRSQMIFDNVHAVGVLSPCALVWTNCQSKNALPRIRNSAQRPTLSECFEATLTLAADYRSVGTSAISKDSLTLNSCCLSAIHRPPARLRGHGGLLSEP